MRLKVAKLTYKFIKWFVMVTIILPYLALHILNGYWYIMDYRHVKSVVLQGITYTLAKKPYCKHNCHELVQCRDEPECRMRRFGYGYNHEIFYDVNILDIRVQDEKLIVTSNQDISSKFEQPVTQPKITCRAPVFNNDIHLNHVVCQYSPVQGQINDIIVEYPDHSTLAE